VQDAALGFAGTAVLVRMHLVQRPGAQDTYARMFLHRHGSKGEGLYLAQHSIADTSGVLIVLLQARQKPATTSRMPTCC
jgi:hypothetical protein